MCPPALHIQEEPLKLSLPSAKILSLVYIILRLHINHCVLHKYLYVNTHICAI